MKWYPKDTWVPDPNPMPQIGWTALILISAAWGHVEDLYYKVVHASKPINVHPKVLTVEEFTRIFDHATQEAISNDELEERYAKLKEEKEI